MRGRETVTFVETITALSDRFLSERAFQLIVAPALADFEYDAGATARSRLTREHFAVLAAFTGAIWDDAIRGNVWTFAGLVFMPACYYCFFFLLGLPAGFDRLPLNLIAALGFAVFTLSLAPALVCFWPERPSRKPSSE
jgi:hypothetical protein